MDDGLEADGTLLGLLKPYPCVYPREQQLNPDLGSFLDLSTPGFCSVVTGPLYLSVFIYKVE